MIEGVFGHDNKFFNKIIRATDPYDVSSLESGIWFSDFACHVISFDACRKITIKTRIPAQHIPDGRHKMLCKQVHENFEKLRKIHGLLSSGNKRVTLICLWPKEGT